jgi:hypothetical protein
MENRNRTAIQNSKITQTLHTFTRRGKVTAHAYHEEKGSDYQEYRAARF